MIPKPDGNSGARPVPTDSQVSSGEFELIDFKSDRDFENFGNSGFWINSGFENTRILDVESVWILESGILCHWGLDLGIAMKCISGSLSLAVLTWLNKIRHFCARSHLCARSFALRCRKITQRCGMTHDDHDDHRHSEFAVR